MAHFSSTGSSSAEEVVGGGARAGSGATIEGGPAVSQAMLEGKGVGAKGSQALVPQDGAKVRVAAAVPVLQVPQEELKRIAALFDSLDTSGDGSISRAELIRAMRKQPEAAIHYIM